MDQKPPKISCIISTYGDAQYIEKKIKEIRSQTFFDQAEFIFVETASPDRERDLITPYTEEFSNIKIITSETRHTLYQTWNMDWDETVVQEMTIHTSRDLCSFLIAYQRHDFAGGLNSFDHNRLKLQFTA